jgi:Tol biopolymer transport system component
MRFANGTHVGPYEIVGWLGAGGMGDVYRARDPRLDREVAIKLIPQAFASDASRIRRFEQEARAAGRLNHPNILAVYDIGVHAGAPYIVSELLQGASLGSRLAHGASSNGSGILTIYQAIDFARQTAEGLAAAHDQGIIHRDVKPDNLFITGDGRIKILDFGIAKLARPSGEFGVAVGASTETDAGTVVGTASYMSPEQIRGEAVDARSDLFSFGAILYEMLAACPAFLRETRAETMTAILKEEPAQPFPSGVPVALVRIVWRCLEKTREARFQSARDLAFALESLSGENASFTPAERPAALRHRRLAAGVAAVVLSVIAGTVGWMTRNIAAESVDFDGATFTLLANWEGTEEGAEISPDGQYVAFLSDRAGEFDIWQTRVGTGVFTNLTEHFPPLASSGFIVRKLGFSGDGRDIWFNPADGKPPMLMPAIGGAARPFLAAGTNTPAWSPDGRTLVYIDKANRDDPMYLADGSGADARLILAPGTLKNMNPVWSPDGEWIYFGRGSEPQEETEIDVWRLRPSGEPPERITNQHLAINFLAPLDGGRVLYIARGEDRSGPWLWSLDVASGISKRVPSGVDQYTSVSTSRDGKRIVATVANPSASLWRVPLLDRPAEEGDVRRYPLPEPPGMALAPRFGESSLFYLSARGTGDGLWKVQGGTVSQVRRSVDGAMSEPAAVSPDGRVAVVIRREGTRRLAIMSDDGTNARTLAPSIEIEGAAGQGAADWSPDGKRIVTGGRDEKGPALFMIAVDTDDAVRLRDGTWVNPVWSPRGDLIIYAGRSVIGQVQIHGMRPDGTPVELPHLLARPGGYRFLPDGSGLVYLPRIPSLDFWLLDLAAKTSRPLTRLDNQGGLRTFDITRDGTSIVFDRSRQNSNIVLIELPK